jgi:prolyl-tRNA synthetase
LVPRIADGVVEIKNRKTGERSTASLESVLAGLTQSKAA